MHIRHTIVTRIRTAFLKVFPLKALPLSYITTRPLNLFSYLNPPFREGIFILVYRTFICSRHYINSIFIIFIYLSFSGFLKGCFFSLGFPLLRFCKLKGLTRRPLPESHNTPTGDHAARFDQRPQEPNAAFFLTLPTLYTLHNVN